MYIKKLIKRNLNENSFVVEIFSLIFLIVINRLKIFEFYFNLIDRDIFIIILLVFILICYGLLRTKVLNFNLSKYVDDIIFRILLVVTIFYIIDNFVLLNHDLILLNLINCITVLSLIFLALRLLFYREEIIKKSDTTVLDLSDFLNKDDLENRMLFLEECDVSYDLLNRDRIINDFYMSIENCKNKKKFVMSLTGEWGSGKSTIINIVKNRLLKNEEYIIIDDFDVLKYNSSSTLFYDFFESILKSTGIKLNFIDLNNFYNTCISIISDRTSIDFNQLLKIDNNKNLQKIKTEISYFLESTNKRIVFFIDNLERTECENILFVLKAITTLLNLDRTIYVLSYDENEMKRVFEQKLNINYDYIEKIVQLPLVVPEISQSDLNNITSLVLKKIFRLYKADLDFKLEEAFVLLLGRSIKSIRSLKRKVNSVVNSSLANNNYLNKFDTLLIEILRQDNSDLYYEIKQNGEYFISEENNLLGIDFYDAKLFNHNAQEFFDKLFSIYNNKDYEQVLRFLFPNIGLYFDAKARGKRIAIKNENPSVIIPRNLENLKNSVKDRRIYNGRFFSLYFTKQNNEFINIENKVKHFVNNIVNNQKCSYSDLNLAFRELLKSEESYLQRFIIENIEFYVNDMHINVLNFIKSIFQSNNYYDKEISFFGLNSYDRVQVFTASLINLLDPKEFIEFQNFLSNRYIDVLFLNKIVYWLNPVRNTQRNNDLLNYQTIKSIYEKLINDFVSRELSIYDQMYYRLYNLHCFIEDDINYPVSNFLTPDTIMLFLADILIVSNSSKGNGYSINKKIFDKFCSFELADNLINSKINYSSNSIELSILKVYSAFKESGKDIKENIVYFQEAIPLWDLKIILI